MPQPDEKESLDDLVKQIFTEVMGLRCPIREDDTIFEDLGADSLDLREICNEISTHFDLEPQADDVAKWNTIGDVIRFVRSKLWLTFVQADVDAIVARAKTLGAGPGLAFKLGQFKLSNFAEPHDSHVLAHVIVGGWDEKWDLIWATQALIEFLTGRFI